MKYRFTPGNILKITLVLAWLAMIGYVVQKPGEITEIKLDEADYLTDTETWMSVYFKGQKVGYSEQALTRVAGGFSTRQNTYVRLKMMERVQEIRTMVTARLNEDLTLKSFEFFLAAGGVKYQLSGRVSGLTLELDSRTGGHTGRTDIPLESVPRLPSSLTYYISRAGLKEGERYRLPIFDPSSFSSKTVSVVVEGKEKLMIDGEPVDTFRLRMDYQDTQTYTWIDGAGRTIKEEGLIGFSMVRTTEEAARTGVAGRAELADVVETTSAPVNRTIEKPRNVKYLKARLVGVELDGLDVDGGRQRLTGDVVEVTRETIDVRDDRNRPILASEFRPDLKPTLFIQSEDRRIVRQMRSILSNEPSALQATEKINTWVFEHLKKRPTLSMPSAVDVLEEKVGDCNEHSVLAAALFRAAGLPCRLAIGVLYFQNRFYYHAWVEVFWGQWTAVDPLLGQLPADATHIRFLTGPLNRQAELTRIIDRLSIEILEIR